MKHLHCSLRSGKPDQSIAKALGDWSETADVITLTEATGFRQVIADVGGWGSYQAPASTRADNVALLWNSSVYRKVASGHEDTGTVPYELRGVHNMVTDECAWVVLERKDKPGHRELWTVSHLPSSVQGSFDNPDQRVRAWKSDATNWAQVVEKLRNRFPRLDGVFVVADWNLDMNQPWCRREVEERFQGLKLTYAKDSSSRGTLDDRVIDATASNIKPTMAPKVLALTDASDHRPYIEGFFQVASDPEKDPPDTTSGGTSGSGGSGGTTTPPDAVGTPTDGSVPTRPPDAIIPVQKDTGPKIDHTECCGGRTLV